MGLLVSGALFFLWGVVFSAEPGETAEEASDSAQAAQAVESLRQTSALDPGLMEALKGPERLEPPDLPNPLRLDPMFTEFPELFTDPKMKSLSQEEYKAESSFVTRRFTMGVLRPAIGRIMKGQQIFSPN